MKKQVTKQNGAEGSFHDRSSIDSEVSQTDEILAFQHELKEAEKKVSTLRSAIEEQKTLIAQAQASVPDVRDLTEKRENLLAEIATGGSSQEELRRLDEEKEIVFKQWVKADEVIQHAEQTIAGLRRKLELADLEVASLDEIKKATLVRFLFDQAELAGAEYARLAVSVGEKFKELMALHLLICRVTGDIDRGFSYYFAPQLKIPAFKLAAHDNPTEPDAALVRFQQDRNLKLFHRPTQHVDEAIQAQLQRIRGLGIRLI